MLTDSYLKSLKPDPHRRIEIRDASRIGLCFRLSPAGNASWILQKKIKGGKRRGQKIGNYPQMSLSQARFEALTLENEAAQGIDRVVERQRSLALEAERLKSQMLISDLVEEYIAKYIQIALKPGLSQKERENQLRKYLTPHFERPASELTRNLIQNIIDDKRATGKMVMANRLRATFSAFTNWAYRRGYIKELISYALDSPTKEYPRQRTPTLSELHEIWKHSFKLGSLWGPFVRLCMLTGQRSRSDVLALKWSWIDFEKMRYEIPNPKNGNAHVVNLSTQSMDELNGLKKKQALANCDFVFSTTGKTASSGVTKAKRRLDTLMNAERIAQGMASIAPWTLHDFRRSQATLLAEAGFDESVVDRIQNHVATGSRPSIVAAVYNKAKKLEARAEALQAWADMITGAEGNVIPFAPRQVV